MAVLEANASDRRSAFSHPRLAALVFALDRQLQRHYDVLEYSANPLCIFRLEICPSRHDLTLHDGTRLRAGQRIAKLHFWNEHLPATEAYATAVRWGIEFHRRIAISLAELARYIALRPDLGDVKIVCGDVTSAVREQSGQIAHIMSRYGFESITEAEPEPFHERLHRLGENVLISILVFVQNAGALRSDTFRRIRVPIYLSRQTLEQRFGGANHPAPQSAVKS
jgi:YkoP domain